MIQFDPISVAITYVKIKYLKKQNCTYVLSLKWLGPLWLWKIHVRLAQSIEPGVFRMPVITNLV